MSANMKLSIFITLILTFSKLFSQTDTSTLYIGVMEEKFSWWAQPFYIHNDSVTKKIARVMFYKQNNNWSSAAHLIASSEQYPDSTNWYITFDGTILGTCTGYKNFKSVDEVSAFDIRDAHQLITDKHVPVAGKPTKEFWGWDDGPTQRPLVLSTQPIANDPQLWRPFYPQYPAYDTLKQLYGPYLHKYQLSSDKSNFNHLLSKSYKANNGNVLIQCTDYYAIDSVNYPNYPVWFFVDTMNNIINISEMIDAQYLEKEFGDIRQSRAILVDAGDYDNDGNSEVIFFASRYNGDGYVLFYDNFTKILIYDWMYH